MLLFNLLLLPAPVTVRQLSALAAAAFIDANARVVTTAVRLAAFLLKPLFRSTATMPRQETLADRLAHVRQLQITPRRFVGYLGQTVTFTALPLNASGQTIQGVRFDWESSDTDKALIDDAGRARLLRPGLVRITCHAGNVQASIPLLVRPNTHPRQSDSEWQADQQSLSETTTTGANRANPVEQLATSLLDHLMPTAQAQAGWTDDLGYDEQWNDPRNLVGTPRNRVAESTRVGTVLPEGSNFDFAAPIVSLGGRGVGANLTLYYNSRLWSRRNNNMAYNAIVGWPAPGFSLGFGRLVTYDISAGGNPTCKYMLIDPDGTRHYLGSGLWAGSGYALGGPFESNDGSHIVYTGNGRDGGSLYYPDGTIIQYTIVNNRLLPTTISDRNGNYVQVAYKPECVQVGTNMYCDVFAPMAIDYIIDTLGRRVEFNYDTNYRLTSITVPGYGGTGQNPVTQTIVQFDYQTVTANGTFSGLTVERGTGGIFTTLKHIYFPATGTGYMPSYSIYGVVTSLSGRRQMSTNWQNVIQDGVESNNVSFNYPTSGPISDAPAFTQRTESATNAPTATYTYASSTNSIAQTKTFTITRPDNSTLNLTRSTNASSVANGLLVQSEVKTSGGAAMAKSVLTYANDSGGEPQVQTVTSYDDAGTPTKMDFDYDAYGNTTNTREYGYQVSGVFQVRRRTRTVYKTDTSYVNAYLRNLVIETDVYDAQLNTSDADDVLMAKTTYVYDNYSAMGGMEEYRDAQGQLPPNPPGHLSWYDASYTQRGNVTGTTQWYDLTNNLSYTRLRKIDVFGNVVKEQLACCNEQTAMASQTYLWAVPEQVTKGSAGGPQLTEQLHYDFNTGKSDWQKDANNQQTQYSYDAALRATQVTAPSGATASTGYNDGSLTVSHTVAYDDSGTPRTITTTTEYDGWGRVIKQTNAHGGQVNTSYDAMGRVASTTNPFTAGGSPSYSSSYNYDVLGRQTTQTLPDSQTVTTSYNGTIVTVTDQVNRKMQRVTDGLGRLVTVNEQDSAGNLTQATSYTYDYLNNLTQVDQGSQLRKYKYDALSRLLYEKIPEQTASINDGTGTYWTSKYTYTDYNAVATRTDARGVVATYSYDALHRLTQVSYNAVSGVTTAPTVTYLYDTDSTYSTTATGMLLRVNVGSDYQERYTFDSDYRIASTVRTLGTRSYTTSYSYNDASQMTQLTYASGLAIAVTHDSTGRMSGLQNAATQANYLSSISYNIAGQVTGDTLGNGVVEQFGYDGARMQMTSQKAGTTSPYTNRLDLSYSYSASSGQMGVGSTAGNAGQTMSVSGTINGTTESASYTYDNYKRLVTSNQTSNSSSANRRFVYDRWGNRTEVWQLSFGGGTQLQAVTLTQSGGVPTNRISSVTNSGTTVNYSYDANGNVTNDGVHSYTYDSENRVVSVDSGTTASYAYDHQNRRYKKTVGSTVTHYVWEDEQVIAEHNGSTGAVQVDYIYDDSRMIAKVANGTTSYFLSDRLSARLTLDTNGAVVGRQAHLPYGEDFAESGTQQKQHFTSYERDSETGTDYAVNRQHNQGVGRFMGVDPIPGSIDIPQSLNRYAYTQNDPIDNTDLEGLDICKVTPRFEGKQKSIRPRAEDPNPGQGLPPVPYLGRELGPHSTDNWWNFFFEIKVEFFNAYNYYFIPWVAAQYHKRSGIAFANDNGTIRRVRQMSIDQPWHYDGPVPLYAELQPANFLLYWIDAPGIVNYVYNESGQQIPIVSASIDFDFYLGIYDPLFGIPLCDLSFRLHLEVDVFAKKKKNRVKWKTTIY